MYLFHEFLHAYLNKASKEYHQKIKKTFRLEFSDDLYQMNFRNEKEVF